MNTHDSYAFHAYSIRLFAALFTCALLLVSCAEHKDEAPTLPESYTAMRKSNLVHARYNAQNPFDSIGIKHNQIVHAIVASMRPWDTLDVSHMLGRCQTTTCSWAMELLHLSQEQSMELVQSAFALRIDSSARRKLAAYAHDGATEREQVYIRRLGDILCARDRFEDTERALDALERDILAEAWPRGDSTEVLARMAISIARHSFVYWKRMMCTVTPGLESDGALAKTAEDLVIRTNSKTKLIVAADVFAGTSAAEAAAGGGILAQIQAGLISAATVSAVVAIIVYSDDIVSFLGSLLPWNW